MSGLSKPVAINSAVLFMLPLLTGNVVGLAGRMKSPFNVYLSNVPGPVAPQYWAGAKLEAMAPFGILMDGAGCSSPY